MKLRLPTSINDSLFEIYDFEKGKLYAIINKFPRFDRMIIEANLDKISEYKLISLDMGIFNKFIDLKLDCFLLKYNFRGEDIKDLIEEYNLATTYVIQQEMYVSEINLQAKALLLAYILLKNNNNLIFYNLSGLNLDTCDMIYDILLNKISQTDKIAIVFDVETQSYYTKLMEINKIKKM